MPMTASSMTCSLLCAILAAGSPAEPVTLARLLDEMTDLGLLTRFPDYDAFQFASYDRRSTAPYEPGWFENSDGFGGEPIPNVLETLEAPNAEGVGRYLVARVEGPGALVRTWTPMPHPMNGRLTVYLDGSDTPIYDDDAGRFLRERPACFAEGFDPQLPGFAQIDSNYFPMPFAQGLRIEWTGTVADLHFYHFGVRRYVPGTPVTTFTVADVEANRERIARVSKALTQTADVPSPGGVRADLPLALEAGARGELMRIDGAGTIRELVIRLEADDMVKGLRQTLLEGYFDGADEPQIEAPLGDFFGSYPGVTPYESLPMSVKEDGTLVCRFAMPFASSAVFRVRNTSDGPIRIAGHRVLDTTPVASEGLMHFFAKWRADHDMEAGGGRDARDLPYLIAFGRGMVVGASALLMNPTDIVTGGGSWWGEGDEKIWVDDDTFPRFFGTGSEDYFNYSWGRPDLFEAPYCAEPICTGPATRGFTVNTRWHVLDPIPFQRHLAFFMELWHHDRTPGFSYARTVYFYATPQTRNDHVRITPAHLAGGLEMPADWRPRAFTQDDVRFFQAEDALEAGGASIESGPAWAAGRAVRWTPDRDGAELTFVIDAPQAGTYELILTGAMSPDAGRFSVAVDDGAPADHVFDLYAPRHTLLRNFHAGVFDLAEGRHVVRLVSRGRHEASAGTAVVMDFLWLWPR